MQSFASELMALRQLPGTLFVPRHRERANDMAWLAAETSRFLADPVLYLGSGLLEGITDGQRARLVATALCATWIWLDDATRAEAEEALNLLLRLLPEDLALQTFFLARQARASHKHTRRVIVRYLLDHPEAEDLFARRRPAVTDALAHGLGKNVLRACLRLVSTEKLSADDAVYLRRNVFRYVANANRAVRLLASLKVATPIEGEVRYTKTSAALRHAFAWKPARPESVTAQNRGELTGALTALYRQEPATGLREAFANGLNQLVERAPSYSGSMALVYDASASMAGYGERAGCVASSAMALRLTLERTANDLRLYPVGGDGIAGALPELKGATDLAGAVLDALLDKPDLVLIVTDGYENRFGGDLARVAATLERLGVTVPVALVVPTFSASDDLSRRKPVATWPLLAFWHENELPELLLLAFAQAPDSRAMARAYFEKRKQRIA
ncbi:MAG: VWA domain-containing protein [Armatimonas sp.]